METTNSIRKASIWIFILPLIILNLCLFISVNWHLFQHTIFQVDPIGQSGFTIPYIDGSLSISRTARTYPTYLLFKPGMIITAILLIRYWITNNNLFLVINEKKGLNIFTIFGVGSAIFLILHSIFFNINYEIDVYKFFQRFVLLGFIIFEIIAQFLLVKNIYKVKKKIENLINKKVLYLKMILVSLLVLVAILSAPILNSSDYTHFKHALEWNYFLGIVLFYFLTYLFWKSDEKTSVHTPEGA